MMFTCGLAADILFYSFSEWVLYATDPHLAEMGSILLILLPIALLFAESSMNNLQSVSIVAAFPIGAVIVMIAVSFMKDAKKYMENLEKSAKEKGEK